MGTGNSRDAGYLFNAMQRGREAEMLELLKQKPELANCSFIKGFTNPICRAVNLQNRNMVMLLLEHGANINAQSRDGRTPLMWACIKNDTVMMELLLSRGADTALEDNEGFNCFDLAVIKLNYDAAYLLHSKWGMTRPVEERNKYSQKHEFDMEKIYKREFDIELFFFFLENGREKISDREIFFEKERIKYNEWVQKDLVVDTRESWREWFSRQSRFEDAPLVPREELPAEYQPNASFYGKMVNIMYGIDPTPPEQKKDRQKSVKVTKSASGEQDFSDVLSPRPQEQRS